MLSAFSPLSSLVLLGLEEIRFFGGVFCSTFSCILLAELVVGRIIRERKSLPGAFVLAILVRGLGLGFCSVVRAGNDDRGALLRIFAVLGLGPFSPVALFKVDALDGFAIPALLSGRGGTVLPVFAEDAAVDAVAAPGRRTGRVGDLGFGLTVTGERGPDFFDVAVETAPLGLLDDGPVVCMALVLEERRFDLVMGAFDRSFSAVSCASPDCVCCLGVGCLGDTVFSRGCFKDDLLAIGDAGVVPPVGALVFSTIDGEDSTALAADGAWDLLAVGGRAGVVLSLGDPLTFGVSTAFAGVDFGDALVFLTGVEGLTGAAVFLGLFCGLFCWLDFFEDSPSSSKSDPLRSVPRDSPLGASAAPPETAPSSLGSEGSMEEASSSPAVFGLSGLTASVLVASSISRVPLPSFFATSGLACSLDNSWPSSCFSGFVATPLVFGISGSSARIPAFGSLAPSVTEVWSSLLPMDSL